MKPTRRCPRCTYPMTALEVGDGGVVDHCHRCGGTAVEPGHVASNVGEWAEPQHWKEALASMTTGERLVCPVDHAPMIGYQVRCRSESVVVDHCNTCGTLFLDHGEGEKLVRIVRTAQSEGHARAGSDYAATELERRQETEEPGGAGSYVFQLLTGMPVEVWNPVRGSTPGKTAMLGLIVAVFAVQLSIALSSPERAQQLVNTLGLVPAEFFERPWGIVTHAFLHGGLMHLVGNAYFLSVFGDNVEDRVGLGRFLGIYWAAALIGGLVHLVFFANETMPMIGASGAIAGLMGAYLMLFPRVKLWVVLFFVRWRISIVVYLGFWVLMQLLLAALGVTQIAWTAHLGGFAVGLLVGWLLRDTPPRLTRGEKSAMARDHGRMHEM